MLPPRSHPLLPVPTTGTLVQAAIISGWGHHAGLQLTSLNPPWLPSHSLQFRQNDCLKGKSDHGTPQFKNIPIAPHGTWGRAKEAGPNPPFQLEANLSLTHSFCPVHRSHHIYPMSFLTPGPLHILSLAFGLFLAFPNILV